MNSQSVTPDSLIVASVCTYTFQFQISSAVPANARVHIGFPSTSISAPSGLTSTGVSVTVYGTKISSLSVAVQSNVIQISNAFGGVATQPSSTQSIVITVSNVQNPLSMNPSATFRIQTLDSSGYPIDQIISGLTVQMTLPAELQLVTGFPNPLAPIVRSFTSIEFDVIMKIPFVSATYILVTFPSDIQLLESALNCVLTGGFDETADPCSIYSSSPSPQIVKITDTLNDFELQFQIGYGLNPTSNKPTGSFSIGIYDSSDNMISSQTTGLSYASTPDQVYSVTVLRKITEINIETGNSLTLSFSATNYLMNAEYFLIRIPKDQMSVHSSAFECQAAQGSNTLTSSQCTLDETSSTTYFIVTLRVPCPVECSDQSDYTVVFSAGVINPPWIKPDITSSVQIQTMTSDLLWIRDQILTGVLVTPELTEGLITDYSIAKGNPIVNEQTDLTVKFNTLNNIPANGIIAVNLPRYSFYKVDGQIPVCLNLLTQATVICEAILFDDEAMGIKSIKMPGLCPSGCTAGTNVQLFFSQILNRASTRPIQNYFEIRTFTVEEYRIDLATITTATGLTLQPAAFSSIALKTPISPIVTGAVDTYTFQFTSVNGMAPNSIGTAQVVFPSEVTISSSPSSCSATVLSTSLGCAIDHTNHQLLITNTDSLLNFANEVITVTLAGVASNPHTSKPSNAFNIQILLFDTVDQVNYLVDQDTQSLVVICDTPNLLKEVSVTRDEFTINVAAVASFTLKTFNPVPKNGLIQVSIPTDHFVIASLQGLSVSDAITGNPITVASGTNLNGSPATYQVITLKEWCSAALTECPASTTLSFKMSGLKNGPSTRPSSLSVKLEIFTADGLYFTDSLVSGLQPTPQLSAGPFKSLMLTQSSSRVGDQTSLTVQVQISNQITPGDIGSIQVLFPASLFFKGSSDLSCSIDGSSTLCSSVTADSVIGLYYQSIKVAMDCGTQSCASGVSKIIVISELLNRFSTKPISGTVSVSSLDDLDYAFDSSSQQLQASQLPLSLLVGLQGQFLSLSRSSNIVSQLTTLTLTIQTSVRLLGSSSIRMMIPTDSFTKNTGSSISCIDLSQSISVSCFLSDTTSTYYTIQLPAYCVPAAGGFCSDSSTLSLQVSGFANRYNTMPGQTSLYFTTQTSDLYQIEQSANTLLPLSTLEPASAVFINDFTLTPTSVGLSTIFKVNLELKNSFKANDFILFKFSQELIFRVNAVACKVSSLSNSLATSACVPTTSNQMLSSVLLTLPFNQVIHQNVQIQISGLVNLLEAAPYTTTIDMLAYTQASDGVTQYFISKASLDLNAKQVLTPCPFSSLTITRSESQLTLPTSLTVAFKTPISIMPGSSLIFQIPKVQVTYLTSLAAITYNILGFNSGLTVTEDTDFIGFKGTDQVCLLGQSCPIGTTITFLFGQLVNPDYQMFNQLSFLLSITSPNGYGILSTEGTTVLAIPPLKLGAIDKIRIIQSGSIVTSALTQYDFSFRLPQTLSTVYQVVLNFPDGTLMPAPSGPPVCKDLSMKLTFTCVANLPLSPGGYILSIVLTNFCSIASCKSGSIHSPTIQNIANVDFARQRSDKITIQTASPLGYLTAQGEYQEANNLPAFEVQALQNVSVTRDTAVIGQTDLDLTISFIVPAKLPIGSVITYYLPQEQQSLKNRLQCVAVTPKLSQSTLNCLTLSSNSSFAVFEVKQWCQGVCLPNTVMTLIVKNTNNPNSLTANDPTYSYGVVIQNPEGYIISQVLSGINVQPRLAGLPFNRTSVTIGNGILGNEDVLTLSFVMLTRVGVDANMTFQIPVNTSFPSLSTSNECQVLGPTGFVSTYCSSTPYENSSVYGVSPITNVTIVNFCSQASPCMANHLQVIKVPITNPRSPGGIQSINGSSKFNVTFRAGARDMGRFFVINNLTQYRPSVLIGSLSLQTDCAFTGELCILAMEVVTSNPFPPIPSSFLQVTVPSMVTLTQTTQCTATIFQKSMACLIKTSGTFGGSQILQFRYNQSIADSVLFQSNYQLTIVISLTNVRNPYSTVPTSSFLMQTNMIFKNVNYQIDVLQTPLFYPEVQPSSFKPIAVTRSSNSPMNSTNLLFNFTVNCIMPQDVVFFITFPETQVIMHSRPGGDPTCTLFANKKRALPCIIGQEQQLTINNVCEPNGCSPGQKVLFQASDTFIYNPASQKATYDAQADSISITAFLENGGSIIEYQKSNTGVFLSPDLNMTGVGRRTNSTLDKLLMSRVTLSNTKLSAFASLSFTTWYNKSSLFSQDNLRVRITNLSLQVDPFYSLQVQVNQTKVKSSVTTMTNSYGEIVLDYVTFECNAVCKRSSKLAITVTGFRNPSYQVTSKSSLISPSLQFAEMEDSQGTVYQQTSNTLQSITTSFIPSPVQTTQFTFSNYSPSASSNSLSVVFSIPENPKVNTDSTISLGLPTGFTILSNPSCSNIFSDKKLTCQASKSGTVTVKGYFSKSQTSRRLLDTLASQTSDSLTVIAITIQNITNPKVTNSSSSLSLTLQAAQGTYLNSSMTISTFSLSSSCAQNCSLCNALNTSQCLQCTVPSLTPLWQDYQCVQKCSSGYFEFESVCYKCAAGCLECDTYNQCTSCQSSMTLIDAACFSTKNSVGESLSCPVGTKQDSQYGCVSDQGCQQTQCKLCGVNTEYCHVCQDGYMSFFGTCINPCPEGYSGESGKSCQKCDSSCETCKGGPSMCSSCRNDLYNGLLLDLQTHKCSLSCSDGTFIQSNDLQTCNLCSSSCSTCSQVASNCTTCSMDKDTYQDLFLLNGQCSTSCPFGEYPNPDTHTCQPATYQLLQGAPLWLIISIALTLILLIVSKVRSGRKDNTSDIALALLTQLEALNRIILVVGVWSSDLVGCLTVLGMNLLINSFLGLYFFGLVMEPIIKNATNHTPQGSKLFNAVVLLSEFTGTNTMRLATSNFMGAAALSNEKLLSLHFYVSQLEGMSLISAIFNVTQMLICIPLLFNFGFSQMQFGFAVNSLLINPVIIGLVLAKYRRYLQLLEQYKPMQLDNTEQAVGPV